MIAISILIGLSAFGALVGLICRLNALHWRDNKPSVIVLHIGLSFSVVWALHDALLQSITPGSIGAVVAALCWLMISWPTWAKKPPHHAFKQTGAQ
ncbi:MAG: hypothetical protein ING25_10640 [Burkholderiales bacterium]|jgi:hypothetical protein|nr:hypothetical protein [Burkholderiales bacterium]